LTLTVMTSCLVQWLALAEGVSAAVPSDATAEERKTLEKSDSRETRDRRSCPAPTEADRLGGYRTTVIVERERGLVTLHRIPLAPTDAAGRPQPCRGSGSVSSPASSPSLIRSTETTRSPFAVANTITP